MAELDPVKTRDLPKQTVMQLFDAAAREKPGEPALRQKVGGVWKDTSWSDYHREIRLAARGLIALGLEPKRGVSLIGFNCPQWLIGNVAAIYAGGVPVGIYTTSTPPQCKYVAGHSDSNIVIVENQEQLVKILAIRDELPVLKAIVMMRGEPSAEQTGVYSWKQLLAKAGEVDDAELDERIAAQKPDDLCTLIYTSGTTGDPKGVMLSHDNLVWTSYVAAFSIDLSGSMVTLSYLPLSHIAEQILSIYVPTQHRGCTAFAEGFEQLGDNLREIRPHSFVGVPRVWEKIQAKMMDAGAKNTGLKKAIAKWARGVGTKAARARERGEAPPLAYGLADKLVFSKVRERLGLDRSVYQVSSAAPIAKETLEFFASLGILINEVYGMSECTGPATISNPGRFKIGWVGYTLPGAEVKVADDGEICMRGRNVYLGYYKNQAATDEAVDGDRWLHSGDIGEKVGDLFRITDRKKDLIITAGGENIAPQVIEGKLKNLAWISQAVVVGDGKKHLSALLTLDEEKLDRILKESGSTAETLAEAAKDPKVETFVFAAVEQVNEELAQVQKIKKIKILPKDLSIETGELTPTMKLKRKVVREKYGDLIDAFYA
ncbi:AMP-dependent synthetase/ligase [Nannocystaceae bacterium ST9]